MSHEHVIALHEIGRYFNVEIGAPPPHREKLGVDAPVLEQTLKTLNLTDERIQINFYRNEPHILMAPDGTGHVNAVTHAIAAEREQQKVRRPVQKDIATEKVILMLPYRDTETRTPEITARHASGKLREGFSHIPAVRYLFGLTQTDNIAERSGKIVELAIMIEQAGVLAAGLLIVGGGFHVLHAEFTPPAMILTGSITYAINSLYNHWSLKQLAKMDFDEKDMPFGEEVKEIIAHLNNHPRTILYPESMVQEWIVPGTLYAIQKLSQKNMIIPRNPKS